MPASVGGNRRGRGGGHQNHLRLRPEGVSRRERPCDRRRAEKCTGLYNAEGRFAPTYDENDTITLPCDNVVLSIGQCIEWGDLLNGEAVQLGRGQGAVADMLTYQTAQPDIFVGGDVCTGPRFAIDAIAAGKQGAISIHRFVQPNTSLTIGRNRRDFHELDKSNLALGEYDRAPRQSAALDAGIDAHRSFRDAP